MGNPLFEPAQKTLPAPLERTCPSRPTRRLERTSFRHPPVHPSLEDIEGGDTGWSGWTRNIRQRAEVLHTDAPLPAGASAEGESRQQSATEGIAEVLHNNVKLDQPVQHRYTLRLGYDPRVFLEDPALRGQQLTHEAEAWAASYRSRIPMTTNIQMARRAEPEPRQHVQLEGAAGLPGSALPSYVSGLLLARTIRASSSDDEAEFEDAHVAEVGLSTRARGSRRAHRAPDETPGRMSILHQLAAQDSPFRTATPRERLSMLGEAISAATWEIRNVGAQVSNREGNREESRERERAGYRANSGLSDRLQELERLLGEESSSGSHRRISEYLQRQAGSTSRNRAFEST